MKPISTQERTARPAGPSASKKEPLPIAASAGSERCQVGTDTDSPCGRPAAIEVLGVLFCERCAREQEDYFAIGELTQIPRGRRAVPGGLVRDARTPPSRGSAKRLRRSRGTAAKRDKVPFLLIVLVFSALASAACGATEQARGESAAAGPQAEPERGAKERPQDVEARVRGNATDRALALAGDAVARADGVAARADGARASTRDAKARAESTAIVGNGWGRDEEGNVEKNDGPQKVTLRITGDPETRFSGACSVGEEERSLNGRTPQRYAFEPRGKTLECRVRKESEGALEIVFADGEGVRSVQRTNAGESTVGFVYSDSGISSSTSSVSMGRIVTSSGGSSSDDSP